jgi:hypothetical protein
VIKAKERRVKTQASKGYGITKSQTQMTKFCKIKAKKGTEDKEACAFFCDDVDWNQKVSELKLLKYEKKLRNIKKRNKK